MAKFTADQRIAQLKLDLLESKPVELSFDGDDVTGNAGVLLAAQAERLTNLIEGAALRLEDHRTASLIKHNHFEQIAQRVFQIIAGFAATDDSDRLRHDPAIKTAVGREPLSGANLASQPTQHRFETSRNFKELYRLCEWLIDYYIQCQKRTPKEIVLDFDGSAIETFGVQLQAFWRGGPYKKYMYFPLFVFDQNGWLLVAALRPGDEGEVQLALPVLKRLVKKLREAWPALRITVRADGAFTHKDLYRWMDENKVQYALAIKHNNSLLAKSKLIRQAVQTKFKRSFGEPQFKGRGANKRKVQQMKQIRSTHNPKERRRKAAEERDRRVRICGEFMYQARSWDRERRVICRCDYSDTGLEVRYVVTNIKVFTPQQIYENIYCQRALVELWIKNIKETRCDRLSCSQFKSNMFRLLLHAMAYVLIHQVKQRLPEKYRQITVRQFQREFVNVAAHVRETGRHVQFRFARSYHLARHFRTASRRLGASSLLAA